MAARTLASPNQTFAAVSGVYYVANVPGEAQIGDRLSIVYSWDGGNAITIPSGWTQGASLDCSADGQNIRVYYKDDPVASGDPSSYTWENDGQPAAACKWFVHSGRAAGPPTIGAASVQNTSQASGATVTVTGLTAAAGDDLILAGALDKLGQTAVWATSSYTAGLTSSADANADWTTVFGATQNALSAGPTGNKTLTITRSSGTGNTGYGAVLLAWPVASGTTVSLTGNAATGAAGTVASSRAKALTTNGATAAVGTVKAGNAEPQTGVAGAAAVGALAASRTVALTGASAAAAVGTVSPQASKGLTGSAASGAAGTVTPSVGIVVAITGTAATAAAGSLGPATVPVLSGVPSSALPGAVGGATSRAVSGVAATGGVGAVASARASALTAATGAGAAGSLAPSTSVGVNGAAGSGPVGTVTPGTGGVIALTGVAAIAAVGAIGVSRSLPLTGQGAASGVGAVTPVTGVSAVLTSVGAAGAVGAVGSARSIAALGLAGSLEAGVIVPGLQVAIGAAHAAAAGVGLLSLSRVVQLVGQMVSGAAGNVAASGGVGPAVQGRRGRFDTAQLPRTSGPTLHRENASTLRRRN